MKTTQPLRGKKITLRYLYATHQSRQGLLVLAFRRLSEKLKE
jgi:hypothetical protein